MVGTREIADLQNKLVLCFANLINVKWDYLLISFEREVVDNEPTEDCLEVIFTRQGGKWERNSIRPPYECYDLFVKMSILMSKGEKGFWGSCTPTLAPGTSGDGRLGPKPTNEKRPRWPGPPKARGDQPSYAAPLPANWPRPTLRNRAVAPLVVASRVSAAYNVAAGVLPLGLDQ